MNYMLRLRFSAALKKPAETAESFLGAHRATRRQIKHITEDVEENDSCADETQSNYAPSSDVALVGEMQNCKFESRLRLL